MRSAEKFPQVEVHFSLSFARGGWEVYLFERTPRGRIPMRLLIEMLPEVPEGQVAGPAAVIPQEAFPSVVASLKAGLAQAGFLTDVGATEAELKATKYHLEDMRLLAKVPALVRKTGGT